MKIAAILNSHENTKLTNDTILSLRKYVTDNVLVIVDGCCWNSWGRDADLAAFKMQGLNHGHHCAPYRNLILGLKTASESWPDLDWYLYLEYDVLFTSRNYRDDLEKFSKDGYWCVGADARKENYRFPLLESMVGMTFDCSRYLLGCCAFYHGEFIRKLKKMNFFEKFLYLTNDFSKGFFPGFQGYDFGEHLLPTLAHHMGGRIKQLSAFDENRRTWLGDFQKYPIRFRPEITLQECSSNSSIIHPIKNFDHPMRQKQREK